MRMMHDCLRVPDQLADGSVFCACRSVLSDVSSEGGMVRESDSSSWTARCVTRCVNPGSHGSLNETCRSFPCNSVGISWIYSFGFHLIHQSFRFMYITPRRVMRPMLPSEGSGQCLSKQALASPTTQLIKAHNPSNNMRSTWCTGSSTSSTLQIGHATNEW